MELFRHWRTLFKFTEFYTLILDKQIPNIPTILGLSLIVIGVAIVHLMNDIEVK